MKLGMYVPITVGIFYLDYGLSNLRTIEPYMLNKYDTVILILDHAACFDNCYNIIHTMYIKIKTLVHLDSK